MELLHIALDVAAAEDAEGFGGEHGAGVRVLFERVGAIADELRAQQTSSRKKGGSSARRGAKAAEKGSGEGLAAQKKSVRFAAHDLSCLAPPKAQTPGSEVEQARVISALVEVMRMQHELLPCGSADNARAMSAVVRSSLERVQSALDALSHSSYLTSEMALAAQYYAHEVGRDSHTSHLTSPSRSQTSHLTPHT